MTLNKLLFAIAFSIIFTIISSMGITDAYAYSMNLVTLDMFDIFVETIGTAITAPGCIVIGGLALLVSEREKSDGEDTSDADAQRAQACWYQRGK